ncbi:MAG: redoxin family protein [Deltaproteobacteria bacterium]|nr:redoxin family protein [Deltaproteobacteria bacterium]
MNWKNVTIVALISIPLLVILALGFGLDPRAVPSVLPGKAAPECTLRAIGGESRALSSFRGRPVVLNFWASWCVPCEAEHLLLQDAARAYGERVQFLGVVYQDEEENARRYLAQKTSTYPQMMDPASRCAIDYGVAGVPETFFIDAAGTVAAKEVGPVNPAGLSRTLGQMLARGMP